MAKKKMIRLINGAQSLLLLNGKESSRMAAKKAACKTKHKAPAKRHNGTASKTHHSTKAKKIYHRPRRHNPETVIGQAAAVVVGSMATNLAFSYASNMFPQLVASPVIRILGKAGIAYALGKGVEKFAPPSFRSSGKFVALGGYANAATDAVNAFFPSLQTIFLPGGGSMPVQVAQNAQPGGMNDIVTLDAGSDDLFYGTSPSFAGMNDVVAVDDGYFG
jgi:hypothetical protein